MALTGFVPQYLLRSPLPSTNVQYDATGSGQDGASTSISFTHNATAGAYVVLPLITDRAVTLSSMEYAGSAMSLLDSILCDNTSNSGEYGTLYVYGIAGVPSGSQSVTGTVSTAAWWAANTVSYLNVTSVGTITTSDGLSASPSITATCTSGQMLVGALGFGYEFGSATSISSPTGGTSRYLQGQSGNNSSGLSIMDSTSSTTFAASLSTATDPWAGITVVLI
jgi:hypothetical protein